MRRISLKIKILAALIILTLVFLGWVLFFNRYFEIENVTVAGGQKIEDYKIYNIIGEQMEKKKLLFFNQSNIFIFSKRQAKKNILENYFVDNLKIKRKLPKTIKISFTERKPAAVWREGDEYYYIDENMNVLLKIDSLNVSTADYIILKNNSEESEIKKDKTVNKVEVGEEYLKACLNLTAKAKSAGIPIDRNCEVSKKEASINLNVVDNGPKIFFNIEEDLGAQFKKLEILILGKLKGEALKKLDYIDLRFGEKVYYK